MNQSSKNESNNPDNFFQRLNQLRDESSKITEQINLKINEQAPEQEIAILKEKRKKLWDEIESLEKLLNNEANTNENTNSIINQTKKSIDLNIDNSDLEIETCNTECENQIENENEIGSKLDEINHQIFHHDSFRGFQKEAIQSVIEGNDVFVITPTGFGKSLIYQISGFYDNKLTIVISPFISLIQDQIRSLMDLKLNSAAFLSSIDNSDYFDALKKIENDEFFFLFLTPEKLMLSEHLCNFLVEMHKKGKISRFVIDEAQCISQLGNDFRPEYRKIKFLREKFEGIHFLALTSTATDKVADDIVHELQMENCKTFRMSFNRSNIVYQVLEKKDIISTYHSILNFISEHNYEKESGIIYCLSAHDTESLSDFLNNHGLSSSFYHGRIKNPTQRFEVQKQWSKGQIKIVVATLSFGMGIDKPDVRFVIHFTIPKSIESFYQESGRAGRDGKCAYSLLFYDQSDCVRLRKNILHKIQMRRRKNVKNPIIESNVENDSTISHSDSEIDFALVQAPDDIESSEESSIQHQMNLLDSIENFCNNVSTCRRELILRYFGEDFDRVNCHERCDVCARIERDTEKICKINMTQACQELCSIIHSIHQNRPNSPPYPTTCYIVSVYLGDNKGAIRMSKDMDIPQYGRGIHFKNRVKTLYKVFPILVEKGILESCLKDFIHGRITYYIPGVNYDQFQQLAENFAKIEIDYQVPKMPDEMNYNEFQLYQQLLSIRDSIVNARGNYPSNFIKYSTIKKIVKEKPKTKQELNSICLPEVKPKAMDLFSARFLKAIRKYEAGQEKDSEMFKNQKK